MWEANSQTWVWLQNEIKKIISLILPSKRILRNKFNKISEKFILWKLQKTVERNERSNKWEDVHLFKDQNKWFMDHYPFFHRSEESSLRWQYSANWSTDSMPSLAKCHLIFKKEIDKTILVFTQEFKGIRTVNTVLKKTKWETYTSLYTLVGVSKTILAFLLIMNLLSNIYKYLSSDYICVILL